jgi:superfamily II DNA/RNA helicase
MSPSFSDLGVARDVAERLANHGITEPFAVQEATIPDALAGRDVAGRAPTGSGKTIAFGVVIAAAVRRQPRPRHPLALVLVPTRELASQVRDEIVRLVPKNVGVAVVFGGVGYEPQRRALAKASVVVACPGRLEDLLARRTVELGDVGLVVVDEADRMADMGFMPAVRRILDLTKDDRQTLLFSATLGGEVDKLVQRYQRDPVRHEVAGTPDDTGDVEHRFVDTSRELRLAATAALVREHDRTIVFCRTRHGADRVAKQLKAAGVDAAAIHGARSQGQREAALGAFSAGRVPALVATDVAARGIHVEAVGCVVHFDPPGSATDYVHRSGRTGRAGANGVVVSLVSPEVRSDVAALRRDLGMAAPGTEAPRPSGRPGSNGRPGGNSRNGRGNGRRPRR